ncbi:MAG: PorV/PorQ family protein [bacterium]
MKKLLLISRVVSFLMLTILTGKLQAEKTFGLPNDYLQYGAGARSLAMGGAFTGLADDASAAYWNPAALAYLEEYQFLTMYAPFRMDTYFNYASLAIPFRKWGAVSVSNVMLLSNKFQERNDLNQITGKDKSVMKNTASISYAHHFYDQIFSAGMKIKFLQERVFSTSGDAIGFDLSLYSKPIKGISCGFVVNNINRPKITLKEAPDIYGRNIKTGIAYHGKNDLYIACIDVNKLEEQSMYFTTGLEINPHSMLSLRAGLNQQNSITAGIGINIWPLRVDYAFSNTEELGVFNKISVTFRWSNIYEANADLERSNAKTDSIFVKGLTNELKFITSVPNIEVKHWHFIIYDAKKMPIENKTGKCRPPKEIMWSMKDDMGRPVKRGQYYYTFEVEYKNNKRWEQKGEFKLDFNGNKINNIDIQVKGEGEIIK